MKVLYIEDEIYMARPVEQLLKQNHYSVDLAHDGEEGLYLGMTGLYDLILLDIMLPKIDGFEVLRQLRAGGITTPIIMLTARDQAEDQINGLDLGADDYLPKPFQYPVLLARLRALARRRDSFQEDSLLKTGDLALDPHSLLLRTKSQSQKLTLKEAQLLELLIQRGKMATPKQLVIDKLWEMDSDAHGSNVEYHVSTLRKKMKLIQTETSIKTVWGVGYILKTKE